MGELTNFALTSSYNIVAAVEIRPLVTLDQRHALFGLVVLKSNRLVKALVKVIVFNNVSFIVID